jgi:hypothetical protein
MLLLIVSRVREHAAHAAVGCFVQKAEASFIFTPLSALYV